MAYTTAQLITGAYYSSSVLSRDFEAISGEQLSEGLQWLNDIITEKVVDNAMIPYETTYPMDFEIGTEIYSIPNLIQINTITFTSNSVRYAMTYEPRNAYFGSPRVNNIQTLPFEWYFERQFGGGNLYVYFSPDQNYPVEIHGIFRLSTVTESQDLSLTIDQFYRTYLRFALADRICAEYNYTTPINVSKQLSKYEAWIKSKSRLIDLRMQKLSTLKTRSSVSWAYVNLGNGYTAPY